MSDYVGRFAPSPTGPLHFGSLLAALASYLDARHHHGYWLLRIEDLDPPREQAGATEAIIACLQAHQLLWDREVLRQSQRSSYYQATLDQLLSQQAAFYCDCSRSQLADSAGIHHSPCPHPGHRASNSAIRLQVSDTTVRLDDLFQAPLQQQLQREVGDFVLRRKDGLFAYQLAVVEDDFRQGINHVIRGADLLDSTPRQLYLQQQLGYPAPRYGHIPVATNPDGEKLSKQTHAPAIDTNSASDNIRRCLAFLRQTSPPAKLQSCRDILQWASQHWQRDRIPAVAQCQPEDI